MFINKIVVISYCKLFVCKYNLGSVYTSDTRRQPEYLCRRELSYIRIELILRKNDAAQLHTAGRPRSIGKHYTAGRVLTLTLILRMAVMYRRFA